MRVTPLLIVLVLFGCRREAEPAARRDTTAARTAPAPQPRFSEPQAVQILLSVDSARIEGALALQEKSRNEGVLEYARVMVADHRAISNALDSLLSVAGQMPAVSTIGQQLQQAASQFAWDISQRDTGVNNSYLAWEIREHERALQLLQGVLIPGTTTPALRSMFEQILPAYHAHLQQARDLQITRSSSTGGAAPARPASPGTGGTNTGGGTGSTSAGAVSAPPASTTPRLLGKPVPYPRRDSIR